MNKECIILILIVALGFLVRILDLGKNPDGFFCDEASIGYNAYSLLTTGKDEHDVSWPIFFQAFGEYKSPISIYSSLPFIYFLGLSEFSVRLVSVFYGVLGIVTIYFLGKTLFSTKIGIISSLFLAISPWHIHFSRIAFELMPFVFFTLLGVFFWYRYWDKHYSTINYFVSIVFFTLSFYSYFPARIFIPLFVILLSVLNIKNLLAKYKVFFAGVLFALILIIPMFTHIFFGKGLSRWNQVKAETKIIDIAKRYLNYFSFDYLFVKGDIDFKGQFITRHSVRGIGELYLFQLPIFVAGIIYLLKNYKKSYSKILFAWLFVYPIAGSLTSDISPQATRSIIGVVPFQIISALGFIKILDFLSNNKLLKNSFILFSFMIFFFSFFNFIKLWQKYPLYSSDFWGWQAGPRDIMKYFLTEKDKYDELYMAGSFNAPEIFIKFYDPKNSCSNKCQIGGIEKYNPKEKQLFAIESDKIKTLSDNKLRLKVQKNVYYPNGQLAFSIGEIVRL